MRSIEIPPAAMPGVVLWNGTAGNEKTPHRKDAGHKYGDHDGTRTRNLQIDSLVL